jgi:hypothetical protein
MTLWVYFVWPEFQEKWIRKQGKKVLVKTRNPLVYGRMRARSREDLREKILHILAIAGVDDRAVEFSCGEYIDDGPKFIEDSCVRCKIDGTKIGAVKFSG